jgi:hypothetical protein
MISFALRLEIRRTKTMARPLKETPMLFGEEAKKFEMRMLNPEPVTEERKTRFRKDYEFMRSRCVNCSF